MFKFDVCQFNAGLAVFHAPEHPEMKRWELEKLPYRSGQTIFVRVANVHPSKLSKEGTSVIVENLDGVGMWKTSTASLENIKAGDTVKAKFATKQLINSGRRKKVKKNKLEFGFKRQNDYNDD